MPSDRNRSGQVPLRPEDFLDGERDALIALMAPDLESAGRVSATSSSQPTGQRTQVRRSMAVTLTHDSPPRGPRRRRIGP
ncbi:MAG: hypothetical protein MZV64_43550 [Ignavibacteriales bacterium]|nr:hypothetical protein [Ignavibacteriales bacterium]